VWAVALLGFGMKLAWPRRFERVSIALYLALGWAGLAAAGAIVRALPTAALVLLLVGGILYSLGVVFHVWRRLRFQNAIWHGFVLSAAACHYAAVVATVVR
jgi:hemolysin III